MNIVSSSSIIMSLSPTMNRRMNFNHELMDLVDSCKPDEKDISVKVQKWLDSKRQEDRDAVIIGSMWWVKDYVCRFRAHWPESRRFTDDLVGEGLQALTELVDSLIEKENFFKSLHNNLHERMRKFLNDNRGYVSASVSTNKRRFSEGRPLEYNFPMQVQDNMLGEEDVNKDYVDILDAVERLAECDREDMHQLITLFLEQDHGIDEASLTDEERQAIERLSGIGRDLL